MPKLGKADQAAKVSANEARRRKEVALAELRELEVSEKAGRLIAAELVTDTWVKIVSGVRASVLRIPDNCAVSFASARDARAARKVLMIECETILRNMADEIRRLADTGAVGDGGRTDATDAGTAVKVG
jgi:phage terminase Nu1 subunit (DNA packaging protein)